MTPAEWKEIALAPKLAIITDLDGSLVPFEIDPKRAVPSREVTRALDELASLDGVALVVASGRTRDDLERFFGASPRIELVAEHGVWVRLGGDWVMTELGESASIEALAEDLERLSAVIEGGHVERKSRGVVLHYRGTSPRDREALLVLAAAMFDRALTANPRLERLDGDEVMEMRVAGVSKRRAVEIVREKLGLQAPIVAFGDDVTDEDMFEALGPHDLSIHVGDGDRPSAARARVPDTRAAFEVLETLLRSRRGADVEPPPLSIESDSPHFDVLVVSNRLPELRSAHGADVKKRNVGGLVSALEPVLARMKSVWLGWSGRTVPGRDRLPRGISQQGPIAFAHFNLPEDWLRRYYNGYSNSALWPVLHSFPHQARFSRGDWEAYEHANEAFADAASAIARRDATVWLHDYHLFLVGSGLRRRGHVGPIGLFLHIPFCSPDLFFILPEGEQIIEALLAIDLVGFHTRAYAENFLRCAAMLEGAEVGDQEIKYRGRTTRVGVFPIGIIPQGFQPTSDAATSTEIKNLLEAIRGRRLVLGVDRLDYTKGIPERLDAFGRFLTEAPEWRGKVSLVQVSVPSRADVREYAEQRARVEGIVGRVNGEHGDAAWVPIRYLYRSYGTDVLAELYRAADVGYVTPLRDGMNLVAKEFVAAQDPERPGVLLLSRFAGAAVELKAALLTNPYDADGMARDLLRALTMPLDERVRRHAALLQVVKRTTAVTWGEDFLAALKETRPIDGEDGARTST